MTGSASRNAKVVCTLGPASDDEATIEGLVDAGMSVARLNASHGTTADRRRLVERVRSAAGDRPVATMLDLPGPEVRTAPREGSVPLAEGETIRFVVDAETTDETDPTTVGLTASVAAAEPGDTVLVDDGRIESTVERVDGEAVFARVTSGGPVGGREGVNVPGVPLDLPAVTEQDRDELALAADVGVDFVAASFVGSAADLYEINDVLEGHDATIPLVAKIERADAVDHLREIVEAADGVMVARGDLGVECPLEDVPIIQKQIIARAREAGVPVIVATEMLDSMAHARRPTRAEAADVANAVLDGTDAVMLSGETAVGDHPVHVVRTMCRIVERVEGSDEYAEARENWVPNAGETTTDALARSARYLARDVDATAIAAASESGFTARRVAKYRPERPVVAVTPNPEVHRQLALSWGVSPRLSSREYESADRVIEHAADEALTVGLADPGDTVVVLSGMMTDLEGANPTNTLKVHLAADVLASGRGITAGRVSGPLVHVEHGDLGDVPDGAVIALSESFDGEFEGDLTGVAAVVHERASATNYAAIIARELGVPMVGGVSLSEVEDGARVAVDGERGVVYSVPEDRAAD
jgi:pyruvate kinase